MKNDVFYPELVVRDGILVTEVTFEDGVKSIGDYAFENCINLEKVTFKGEVEEIDSYAFEDCRNLKIVIVPTESMKNKLADIVPEGCEIKVVEKELEQSQENDVLTPLDINLALDVVELLREACDEIMTSDEKMIYDEVAPNKSKDAR